MRAWSGKKPGVADLTACKSPESGRDNMNRLTDLMCDLIGIAVLFAMLAAVLSIPG